MNPVTPGTVVFPTAVELRRRGPIPLYNMAFDVTPGLPDTRRIIGYVMRRERLLTISTVGNDDKTLESMFLTSSGVLGWAWTIVHGRKVFEECDQ